LRSHGRQSEKPLRIHPENRDEPWAIALGRSRDNLETVFGSLARSTQNALRVELEKIGLSGPDGPHRFDAPPPGQVAVDLAYILARRSLPPLAKAIRSGGGQAAAHNGEWWLREPATDVLPHESIHGIPLFAACSGESVPPEHNGIDWSVRWQVERRLEAFQQIRRHLAARLTELLATEHRLWEIAAAHGGPADRIPYAYRYRALQWFWEPDAHAPGLDAFAVCLRCGELIWPRRTGRPRRASPPLCAHCSSEPPGARRWPTHAVAPDGRGTWWLTCLVPGCENVFVGHGQARRCPECRSSSTTPSKRRKLSEAKPVRSPK
jgi:hypothetical protein